MARRRSLGVIDRAIRGPAKTNDGTRPRGTRDTRFPLAHATNARARRAWSVTRPRAPRTQSSAHLTRVRRSLGDPFPTSASLKESKSNPSPFGHQSVTTGGRPAVEGSRMTVELTRRSHWRSANRRRALLAAGAGKTVAFGIWGSSSSWPRPVAWYAGVGSSGAIRANSPTPPRSSCPRQCTRDREQAHRIQSHRPLGKFAPRP